MVYICSYVCPDSDKKELWDSISLYSSIESAIKTLRADTPRDIRLFALKSNNRAFVVDIWYENEDWDWPDDKILDYYFTRDPDGFWTPKDWTVCHYLIEPMEVDQT